VKASESKMISFATFLLKEGRKTSVDTTKIEKN
jgi:hypothetical protein